MQLKHFLTLIALFAIKYNPLKTIAIPSHHHWGTSTILQSKFQHADGAILHNIALRIVKKKDWNAHKTTCKETNLPPRNEINVFVQQFCKDLRSPISRRQYIHITIVNGKLTGTLKSASFNLDFGTFYAELNEARYSFKLAFPVSLVREKYVKPTSLPDLSHLDETEQSFVRKLADMHIDDILDEGEGQRTCRNLGIEIFNYFKEKNGGDSIAGKRGMQKICEPLKSHRNGTLVQHISRAWNCIGDDKDLRGMWIA